MKKIFLIATVFALVSIASLCMNSVYASIPVEEEERDPVTGYDPPPGESWSWVWQYGEYTPQTQTYHNIQNDHKYNYMHDTGDYWDFWDESKNQYGPWIYQEVWHFHDGTWNPDTCADIYW